MYVDTNELVRVEQDELYDDKPGPVKVVEFRTLVGIKGWEGGSKKPPHSVLCSIAEQGLGPIVWWGEAQVVEDGEGTEGLGVSCRGGRWMGERFREARGCLASVGSGGAQTH
jgi:DNA-directed RNA polymerase III subunit RPC8